MRNTDNEEPIKINGWEDFDGLEDRNPPGQECFKQKYYVEAVAYEDETKCTHVEQESCGEFFQTRFRTSQVRHFGTGLTYP